MHYDASMLKRHAVAVILLVALLTGALLSAIAAPASTNNISPPLRARQLNGMKVEDSDGQKAGTVRNLVLDMNTGNLRYAVIGYGGFLGVRATLKLAPPQVMSAATTKSETLAINVTTPQWRNAPAFKYSRLAALEEPDHAGEIARYFRTSTNTIKTVADSLSKTGRDSAANAQPGQLKFASDVMGMRVVNQKQEKMGEVTDVLVSFGEPRPAFVIISSSRILHHDQRYAVPLKALTFSDKKLIWDVNAGTLQSAPRFDQAAWNSRGQSGQVYRYSTPAD